MPTNHAEILDDLFSDIIRGQSPRYAALSPEARTHATQQPYRCSHTRYWQKYDPRLVLRRFFRSSLTRNRKEIFVHCAAARPYGITHSILTRLQLRKTWNQVNFFSLDRYCCLLPNTRDNRTISFNTDNIHIISRILFLRDGYRNRQTSLIGKSLLNFRLHTGSQHNTLANLGAGNIILIRRKSNHRKNSNDSNNYHEFY
ncbi:hypothetical protein MCC93_22670 [Morococcus cerebrosus]|uniref:Uncharacterized protein n=1 Tax=Morococcus cerebrosus TaxID=1056807 RepID=A0A0C1GWT5_9NEIS|nr:hypothetical protein MCC93_22670 [Morococcus cerebrosus]